MKEMCMEKKNVKIMNGLKKRAITNGIYGIRYERRMVSEQNIITATQQNN